jgi:hypothetical protein
LSLSQWDLVCRTICFRKGNHAGLIKARESALN